MIISELNLIHFGKFHNYHVELGPHMNIIAGDNEAGKTTIYQFIYAMFFGMRRARGRAAVSDLYTRYQPWATPGSYEGSIKFEQKGKNYRLYRNFYKGESSVSLICLDDQKVIPLPHGVIGDFIPGLTEENYKNTMGIPQAHSELDVQFALALESQAANMSMTGNSNLHLGRALEYLRKEKRKLKAQSHTEKIRQINEEIQRLTRDLEKADEANEIFGRKEITDEKNKELDSLMTQIDLIHEASGNCQMEMGMLMEKDRQLQQEIRHLQKQLSRTENQPLRRSGSSSRSLPVYGMISVVMGVLLGLAAVLNYPRLPQWGVISCLVLCCMFLVLGIAGCISIFRFKSEKNNDESEEETALHSRLRDLNLSLRNERVRYDRKKQEKEQLDSQAKSLAARMEKHRQSINRAVWEQEKYNETSNALEDCTEELSRVLEEEKELQKDEICLDRAYRLIEELSGEIHESFGNRLWERAAGILHEITGNTRQFHISRDLKISVDNSKTYVPLERLSRATTEQFYLSVRLGAADLLFASEQVPLVLDDTFAYYDDHRLSALLFWLTSRQPYQVILLSCHHRECDLMDQMNMDYSYVSLSE